MQIEVCPPGAPFAVGILIARSGIVGERHHVGGGDQLVLDRRIDPLEEIERHVMRRSIVPGARSSTKRACATYM